jgi:hypothetical protein
MTTPRAKTRRRVRLTRGKKIGVSDRPARAKSVAWSSTHVRTLRTEEVTVDMPKGKKVPKLPPKPTGGGAAARQRQFEQERGMDVGKREGNADKDKPADDAEPTSCSDEEQKQR